MTKEIYIVFVLFSLIALLYITGYIVKLKEKKQLHKIFLLQVIFLTICNIGYLLLVSADVFVNYKSIVFEYILFFGATFCSAFFLFSSLIYKSGKIKFNYKYVLILIPQIATNVVLWTNNYHHLFYKSYGVSESYDFGNYFYIAMLFTWINLISATAILIYTSVKNSKNFSKQAGLMIFGSLIPVIFNFLWILGSATNIDVLKFYSYYDVSPITLSVTAICFSLAIFKYGFLEIAPIALQKVVDCMADGYIVINTNMELVDYNKSFSNMILSVGKIELKANILDILRDARIIDTEILDILTKNIGQISSKTDTVNIEKNIEINSNIYAIEMTPIISNNNVVGIIIIFKDITELKKTQNVLIEQERLVSLGQLAGGMAHDINTPIAALRTGLDFFKGKYPYTEREQEMLDMMKISAEKITDIVASVRNQIRNMSEDKKIEFNISKVIYNIKLLLNNELEKGSCKLEIEIKNDFKIIGDEGKLTQVIMNIVVNAIQAYERNGGDIRIKSFINGNCGVVQISDDAGGIPEKISSGLFKEILTTKGTKGTGFGMYFSYSMLKAAFGGDITFETKMNQGTVFYVKIPIKREDD